MAMPASIEPVTAAEIAELARYWKARGAEARRGGRARACPLTPGHIHTRAWLEGWDEADTLMVA